MIGNRMLCLVMGYVFGLFQTGYLYGKTQHIDIREHGSGNAGATNTLRTLGANCLFGRRGQDHAGDAAGMASLS